MNGRISDRVYEGYSFTERLKDAIIGRAKTIQDKGLFHKLTLIAFFAWVGLGSDGISSSCYGPEEAFRNLSGNTSLAIFVALGSVFTIIMISTSYAQIIRLFPHGGGGYLVGSKLLSPTIGMISGSSLIIDYVLTISISASSGADALFSFFPMSFQFLKLPFALTGICFLILLNLRGVKESVLSLTPIFVIFIATHVFTIFYGIFIHSSNISEVAGRTANEINSTFSQLGFFATFFIILRAYSMGAGTFTGIEAVSNGMPILREPKVVTARKTLFIDGPRIMANMAIDHWFPKRFASLSDRLVTINGILLMGIGSIILMLISGGSVVFLVVLYSINVFITFTISQTGMVKHWWQVRRNEPKWKGKLAVNGIGLVLTSFILISVIILKFEEGGWLTLLITGALIVLAIIIKRHYFKIAVKLQKVRLNAFSEINALTGNRSSENNGLKKISFKKGGKTAIILVSGFGGTGLYTFLRILDNFKGVYSNIIFIRVGIINSKIYKGMEELEQFKSQVKEDGKKYVAVANQFGLYGKSIWTIGTDPVSEVYRIVKRIRTKLSGAAFFGGQLVFSKTFYLSKLLHNHTIFSIQKRFFKFGIPIVIFPIKVE